MLTDIAAIQELPQDIAEKIAAGEVVTRPLSVVKELIENSLDANSKSIIVEIKDGGKSLIRVTDDGSGIPSEQAETAFRRHATSKIRSAEDLDRINTLGFRGEALTSIAAVSKLELITKTRHEKAGTFLRLEGGALADRKSVGTADGTTVLVSDLFYNTPARLKFMKPDRTESALIIEKVSQIALAYPHVRFRLINNGAILFSTPGNGDLLANILTVYGRDTGGGLLPADSSEGGFALRGYVSPPSKSKSSRKWQIFFINGRSVSSKPLERAVTEGYRETLFEGRRPIVFLFLEVPPDRLDVNIHPAKDEVRFDNEGEIEAFVAASIRKAIRVKEAIPLASSPRKPFAVIPQQGAGDAGTPLGEAASPIDGQGGSAGNGAPLGEAASLQNVSETASPQYSGGRSGENAATASGDAGRPGDPATADSAASGLGSLAASGATGGTNGAFPAGPGETAAGTAVGFGMASGDQLGIMSLLSAKRIEQEEKSGIFRDIDGEPYANPYSGGTQAAPAKGGPVDILAIKPLGTIFMAYIIGMDGNSFFFIDQHAAHERVLYERFLAQSRSSEKLVQQLISPLVIEVPVSAASQSAESLALISGLGYELEPFGTKSFNIRGIPAFLSISESEAFLRILLESLSLKGGEESTAKIERVISNACKKAIKANDRLTETQIRALLAELDKCENPYSCPHGRPVFLRLGKR
ncbi:MAG: DNA mismatch repair endonuclease MutL, partial [Clostridiales Family XIII bacterium]|nr:DNA mismatch repair endonuclease MutL [Clostridiales Family XIII bacterium]